MKEIAKKLSIQPKKSLHYNASRSFYIESALRMGQGHLSKDGALIVKTGKHTGRSANDRYIVENQNTQKSIWWENNLNKMNKDHFSSLKNDLITFLNEHDELFVTERSVGASDRHNISALLFSTHPQHALFSMHLFRDKRRDFQDQDFTIIHAPEFKAKVGSYGNERETIVATCFDTMTTLICGTLYAGEIKKSMFSVMNYRLPEKGILPMHAGASHLPSSECSVFFGLSGTGKTTLSTDIGTQLIGDDEHGLSDEGIFNFEGGCYAKTYKLNKENEPDIWNATNRFGAMIENVTFDHKSGEIDFDDKTLTENGRSSYPLDFIEDVEKSSQGKVPEHIFFLTADAFGVLPPVSKLDSEQAKSYFVLGYTAKLAGTEVGLKEPKATFSPCFGAPFMLRHPSVYAELLHEYITKKDIKVWLINTGWTGGGYGEGERFPLKITRQIIRSIQANKVNDIATEKDPIFGLQVPLEVPGVDSKYLSPQKNWNDSAKYIEAAKKLSQSFKDEMKKYNDASPN